MSDDLDRIRAAYPQLPNEAPPPATIARLRSLYAAPATRAAGIAQRAGRTRSSRRIGLLAIVAVVGAGTAVAATGGWRPILGSNSAPRPSAAVGVPADLRDVLGVLRRPQTAADRGPAVQAALQLLDKQSINGVYTSAIRVIAHEADQTVVLITAERLGDPRFPATVRHPAICLASSSYHAATAVAATEAGKLTTLRVPAAGYHASGESCGSLSTLEIAGIRTGTSLDLGGGLSNGTAPTTPAIREIALVPDGVARVTVRLRGDHEITRPVHDNVYQYTARGIQPDLGATWYDAAGHVIAHGQYP